MTIEQPRQCQVDRPRCCGRGVKCPSTLVGSSMLELGLPYGQSQSVASAEGVAVVIRSKQVSLLVDIFGGRSTEGE